MPAAARETVLMKAAADVMASKQKELMDLLIDETGSTMLKAGL